jgi:hypothetical protein
MSPPTESKESVRLVHIFLLDCIPVAALFRIRACVVQKLHDFAPKFSRRRNDRENRVPRARTESFTPTPRRWTGARVFPNDVATFG